MFSELLDFLIDPYKSYSSLEIILELIAAITGVMSVLLAIRKNIWLYPIGIISTSLYTFLLFNWNLYGDMCINFYYTVMSIYGWILWSHGNREKEIAIANCNRSDYKKVISLGSIGFLCVLLVYVFKYGSVLTIPNIHYLDSIVTALFLVAMWLMAKKKIENWIFWIIGDIIAIPMFIGKGYGVTAIQYLIFTFLAFQGYRMWRRAVP